MEKVGDIFDKSISMNGFELALMGESAKAALATKFWKKKKRYDILQLASAIGGTCLGCAEAFIYYNQTLYVEEDGVRKNLVSTEAWYLTIMRIICSVLAITAGSNSSKIPNGVSEFQEISMWFVSMEFGSHWLRRSRGTLVFLHFEFSKEFGPFGCSEWLCLA